MSVCYMLAWCPLEGARNIQLPWNWRYRWLVATMWGLGLDHRTCTRAASALNQPPNSLSSPMESRMLVQC